MNQNKPLGNRPLTPEELERILALEAALPYHPAQEPPKLREPLAPSLTSPNAVALPDANAITSQQSGVATPLPEVKPVPEAPSLAHAVRRARLDAAEQSQGFADLRSAELARLELLQHSLAPVFDQLPHGHELFDTGIVPGETPRLFIDMIAFVQMGRDKRTYEFKQDRRDGRVMLAQSADLTQMTKNITDYIARRLVQREKALETVSDEPGHWPKRGPAGSVSVSSPTIPPDAVPKLPNAKPSVTAALATPAQSVISAPAIKAAPAMQVVVRRRHGWFMRSLLFLVEFFGVAALLALMIAAGFWLYLRLNGLG